MVIASKFFKSWVVTLDNSHLTFELCSWKKQRIRKQNGERQLYIYRNITPIFCCVSDAILRPWIDLSHILELLNLSSHHLSHSVYMDVWNFALKQVHSGQFWTIWGWRKAQQYAEYSSWVGITVTLAPWPFPVFSATPCFNIQNHYT